MKKLRNSACEGQRSSEAALAHCADFIARYFTRLRFLQRCRRSRPISISVRRVAIAVAVAGVTVPISVSIAGVAVAMPVVDFSVPVARMYRFADGTPRSARCGERHGRNLRFAL